MDEKKFGFTYSHLTKEVVSSILNGMDRNGILDSFSVEPLNSSGGFLNSINEKNPDESMVGIFVLKVNYHYEGTADEMIQTKIVLKCKSTGDKVVEGIGTMIHCSAGRELAEAMKKEYIKLGVVNSHLKDLIFLNSVGPSLKSIMPDVYWTLHDDSQEIYVYAMEYFDPEKFTMIDSLLTGSEWTKTDMIDVVEALAFFHSKYYRRTSEIPAKLQEQVYIYDRANVMAFIDTFKDALILCRSHPDGNIWKEGIPNTNFPTLIKACERMSYIAEIIEKGPLTLIHIDSSIRNICMRKSPQQDQSRVCLYDWELVAIGPPQFDLALLLAASFNNLITQDEIVTEIHDIVKEYIHLLKKNLPVEFQDDTQLQFDEFIKVFDMCFLNFTIHHLGVMTSVLGRALDLSCFKKAVCNSNTYINAIKHEYKFLN